MVIPDIRPSLPSIETNHEIEHILSKATVDKQPSLLSDKSNLESLGNKAVLEKKINIRASDYKLCDKKKYYEGSVIRRGQLSEKTTTKELINIASTKDEFLEEDITERKSTIISSFIEYVRSEDLIQ